MPGQTSEDLSISLADYIKLSTEPLKLKLMSLEIDIGKLEASQVDNRSFDQIKLQVASLSEGVRELDDRLEKLENEAGIGHWLLRHVVTIVIALVIGYLSGFLR